MSVTTGRRPGTALMILLGVIAGILLLGIVRLIAMPPEHHIHFHANWAIFIDGERLDMTGMRFMEDVAACSADPNSQRPEDRVHMHDGNQEIVHVHASGVTWEHLIANIGFVLSDEYLETNEGFYQEDGERTMKFVANGRVVSTLKARPIQDLDRVLISFGTESEEEVLASQFPQVEESAAEYNTRPDPASCMGSVEPTFGEKVQRAFWF